MTNLTPQQFRDYYKQLPDDVRDVYSSAEYTASIIEIGKKNGLFVDQIGHLSDEVGSTMLGITHPDKFVDTIANKLSISNDKANVIAREVNEKIFLNIRASLQKIHSEDGGREEISDTNHTQNDAHFEETPSRESVLAGIEDPKTLGGAPINALTKPVPTFSPTKIPVPPASTAIAKIPTAPLPTTTKAPPPSNLPTRPTSILESKLQSVVKSEKQTPKHDPYREPLA